MAGAGRKQKRMGPAPFASFEDLSDEVRPCVCIGDASVRFTLTRCPQTEISGDTVLAESPRENVLTARLPGISEGLVPSTPRIDISRASSSSQHEDSRDSTPERELFQDQGTHLGLAFREEGALELRSSTEELDFQDPTEARRSPVTSVTAVVNSQSEPQAQHQRKDSQSSDFGGLLSISGRTSRLSSIGSQGSRVSNASHLSVTSGMSRSPSPHKMLLETSFCGSKSGNVQATSHAASYKLVESELMERVLLSRKHDPTEAVLAEGISIECRRKIQPADTLAKLSPVLHHSSVPPEKPVRKTQPQKQNPDVIITVDKPDTKLLPGKTIVSESGVEYTFIPLKGPLPKESEKKSTKINRHLPSTTTKGTTGSLKISNTSKPKENTASLRSKVSNEPQYIRIKLKPDYMYKNEPVDTLPKPASLELRSNGGTPAPAVVRSPKQNSRTPSPSVSRKSSFTSLFRVKDYGTSPESPTIPPSRRKYRSRSKSSDREKAKDTPSDKPSKHRSVFTLFKSRKSCHKSKQSITTESSSPGPGTSLHSLEFTFDKPALKYYEVPLNGDSIIIPLHSPGSEVPQSLTTEEEDKKGKEGRLPVDFSTEMPVVSAEESQESEKFVAVSQSDHRQSSTSSDNVLFSTDLGSTNEIFTTKLPKRNEQVDLEVTSTKQVHEMLENGLDNKSTEELVKSSSPTTVATTLENVEVIEAITTNVTVTSVEATATSLIKVTSVEAVTTNVSVTSVEAIANQKERCNSSESENDVTNDRSVELDGDEQDLCSAHERKGLVLQQDSFDDELPYIPTTLPQERSVAVPIVPVKQRASYEIRTCPIERPRSTTPIHPSCLEDYCEDVMAAVASEKLRISLPREDSITTPATSRVKSPRRQTEAPPLPPRGAPKDWINFEDIPERRKPPKRIQTIPSRSGLHPPEETNVIYSYVNPEDCKCECHEAAGRAAEKREEDELPLLDRRSDSSPESQSGALVSKKGAVPTNAFPHVVTTTS